MGGGGRIQCRKGRKCGGGRVPREERVEKGRSGRKEEGVEREGEEERGEEEERKKEREGWRGEKIGSGEEERREEGGREEEEKMGERERQEKGKVEGRRTDRQRRTELRPGGRGLGEAVDQVSFLTSK
ncbi:hypothetical protein BO85DRAFT_220160 [Aspergillus piperis CBS 112811]|uniref:Uncharacterized protein n=1 Tax=Aspergillus piperis CBS 112811 TaxID=1448313 RepID=A0A8G1VPV7_9EURO|nr:hypothetical protein BO85DRAFT_220160 [Aspergillus piperis CBS 112811]RAH60112.1 hypothetical protein BO85DRAFT_220160 [Aspergillus piperis CBS 112811]